MRRDMGKNLKEELNIKIIKYSAIVVAILTIIVFAIVLQRIIHCPIRAKL